MGPLPCFCFPASRSSERLEWMQGWQLQILPPIRSHRKKSAIRDPHSLPPVSTSQAPGLAALPSGCQASRGSLALGGETRGTPAGMSFCPVTDQHRGQDREMGFERGGGLVSAPLSFWKLTKVPQNFTRGLQRRAGEKRLEAEECAGQLTDSSAVEARPPATPSPPPPQMLQGH